MSQVGKDLGKVTELFLELKIFMDKKGIGLVLFIAWKTIPGFSKH